MASRLQANEVHGDLLTRSENSKILDGVHTPQDPLARRRQV